MSGETRHVGNPGYFANRLPRALATVERGGKGISDAVLEESIETLSALLDFSLSQVGAPPGETTLPRARAVSPGSPVGVGLNVDDDASMISHLNAALSTGAFSAPAPGREERAGAPLPSSRVPMEDRGRTAALIGGPDPTVISGDVPTIPGVPPSVMEWLPTAIWAARKLYALIQQWRNR